MQALMLIWFTLSTAASILAYFLGRADGERRTIVPSEARGYSRGWQECRDHFEAQERATRQSKGY